MRAAGYTPIANIPVYHSQPPHVNKNLCERNTRQGEGAAVECIYERHANH